MQLSFTKYHGTGNDFIIIDDRSQQFPSTDHAFIKSLCTRRFGIGADGLILIREASDNDFNMVYFNADGFEGSMCGNGGRCAVDFVAKLGIIHQECSFRAYDGAHRALIQNGSIKLEMGSVASIMSFNTDYFIDTGSPHYVKFEENIDQKEIEPQALAIKNLPAYQESGINVNFVEAKAPDQIYVRTYERGVEAETYSCGTGVVASAIAQVLKSKSPANSYQIQVDTPGGPLMVRFDLSKDEQISNVWLSGPAQEVYHGSFNLPI